MELAALGIFTVFWWLAGKLADGVLWVVDHTLWLLSLGRIKRWQVYRGWKQLEGSKPVHRGVGLGLMTVVIFYGLLPLVMG